MKKITLLIFISASFYYSQSQNLQFIENKGQWNSSVKFKADVNGNSLFLEKDGYRVLLNEPSELKKIADNLSGHEKDSLNNYILHSHAYEVKLENTNTNPEIITGEALPTYNNYFIGNDQSKWAAHCRIFESVTYKNIYKGIDVQYYTESNHFKYEFTVHPGADPKKIKLLFNGTNGLEISNNDLIIKTSVGALSELKPYTYQIKNIDKNAIQTAFSVSGNTVSFNINNYDKSQDLIIDPTLIFSSYVGSTSDDWGYCSTYDSQGNFFAGSIAFHEGFPVSLGAYQTHYHGGDGSEGAAIADDIAIFKFNAKGTQRLYATYLGGTGDEQPQSLIADKNDNLIISGRTTSADFPVTTGTYGNGGNFDIYVSKLNGDGTALLASRKFGGTGVDGVNIAPKYVTEGIGSIRRNYDDDSRSDVTVDNDNNIYLVGCTQSGNFPTTVNAFKKSLGGKQDGVFIKTSADLSTVYNSTYVGGNGDDAVFSIARNKSGKIFLAGSTTSTDIALDAADDQNIIHKSFKGGECDGFVSIISSDANNLTRTVYIGTTGNDMVYEICTDNFGYPYITGTTTTSFPIVNAVWKQQQGKQFITKLDSTLLTVEYSTNFGKGGSAPDISPIAFAVDKCENVYVAGWGGSANQRYNPQSVTGLSITANAIQKTTDGSDFYIFALSANAGSQLYGSFFGTQDPLAFGDHIDGASSRFDENGNLYLATCANCNKIGTFPTTTGVWSADNKAETGALCNFAGVKIKFDFSNCILPVSLLNFNASYKDQTTFLNWQVTNEVNVDKYEIQHSINTFDYSAIGSVDAHGDNSKIASYNYTQSNVFAGTHFYRLKVIDKDGIYTYSKTVNVVTSGNEKSYIYVSPNPSTNLTTIYFKNIFASGKLIVVNGEGITVKQINIAAGKDQLSFNAASLAAGLYRFIFITNDKKYQANFLKN